MGKNKGYFATTGTPLTPATVNEILATIKNAPTPPIGELTIMVNDSMPDNRVVVSRNIFNLLEKNNAKENR